MRPLSIPLAGSCFLAVAAVTTAGPEADNARVQRLMPPLPGAKPLEVQARIGSFYSAVSKLNNTDTRDGIGVRWNWPKELGDQNWGAAGDLSLVAFPDEHVAFGKHQGFALRLINRGKKPAGFLACDSALFMVQEARDEKGRWREIEMIRAPAAATAITTSPWLQMSTGSSARRRMAVQSRQSSVFEFG